MQEKLEKIIDNYGIQKQMPVWCEELSELIKVICKWQRKYEELEGDLTPQLMADFLDEIADVTIVLEQSKSILHLKDLEKEINYKINRQINRIEKENK